MCSPGSSTVVLAEQRQAVFVIFQGKQKCSITMTFVPSVGLALFPFHWLYFDIIFIYFCYLHRKPSYPLSFRCLLQEISGCIDFDVLVAS